MRSKTKPSRAAALAWARKNSPPSSVLAGSDLLLAPSPEVRHAAAVLVGGPDSECVDRIAARFARLEQLAAPCEELPRVRKHG